MPRPTRRLLRPALVLATLLALAGCSSVENAGMQSARVDYAGAGLGGAEPHEFPVHGIDVSKYQGQIDWAAAARGGVRFAYLKATEGGDRNDEMFQTNWDGARAAGIPTGAYHFFYFCRPASEQVAWFKTHVPPARDSLPPVLDMEWNPQSPTCKIRPPADKVRAEMRVFLQEMEAFYGKKPIIYTTIDFHRDVLTDELADYPFWVRSVKAHPSARYGGRSWAFWQYTATGSVPGVAGKVDRNVFAGSEKEWQAFLEKASRPSESMMTASITQ
ncbi:glycoside hydrolase family 25 protein [Labrys wisconsinensis]|uniref:Lysozyme n=1 Tax=Labrys wisconsinensis TaxID=425677 RepID=A0ABU0JHK8_9HYPH|nr:GH25 family lysozyme [Labrys wisconsinensis]MDQ0472903.1 lysozyme [Labrys wisconsinensis]